VLAGPFENVGDDAVQDLARCLRDAPDAPTAFAAYETLRRVRVEKIAKRGAALNRTKAPGRVARRLMPLIMSLAFRVMPLERMFGAEQRYTIDWDARVDAGPPATPMPDGMRHGGGLRRDRTADL